MENQKKNTPPKFNAYWIYGIIITLLLGMSLFGGDSGFQNVQKTNISAFERYLNDGDITPTGTRIPKHEFQRLRKNLRDDILLVIDEAYGEFADHLNEPTFDMVSENTAVLRTLSKAYGMAGYRVGWGAFAPTIRAELQKVMNPNNVSVAGQTAAATALSDQAYMRETCAITAGLRDGFSNRLRKVGFYIAESFTNFAMIRFHDAWAAQRADATLRAEGIVVRAQSGAGLPDCLRITVGTAEDLDLAASLLEHKAKGGKA